MSASCEALNLTQREFARGFGVSLGTVRIGNNTGGRKPEGPASVLLTVIEQEPRP